MHTYYYYFYHYNYSSFGYVRSMMNTTTAWILANRLEH